jgi:hypothetical protein
VFRRFGHGHSVGVGVLLTLAMERHALLALVLVFVAGFVAGRAWLVWARIGYAARCYFDRRANNLKARGRARLSMLRNDDIPF